MDENKDYNVISDTNESNKKQELKRKAKIKKIAIISSISVAFLGVVGTTATVLVKGLEPNKVEYECEGVDENWLQSHPFSKDGLADSYSKFSGLKLTTPNMPGYNFLFWHVKGDNKPLDLEKYSTKLFGENKIVLVAKFEPIVYQIRLNLNNGKLVGLNNNQYQGHTYVFEEANPNSATTTYICTDKPFSLPKCEREGYDFIDNEWKLVDSKNLLNTVTPSMALSNFDVEADFSLHPYAILYKFEGQGVSEFESEIISNNVHGFDYEQSVPFTEAYLDGYTFEGWFDSNGNQITVIKQHTVPENDVFNVVGKFKPIEYKITYSDKSKSNLESFPKSYKKCSEDIKIPSISPAGYVFHGWISSEVTTLEYTSVIKHGSTGNITLTADLDLIQYKVTFVTNGVADDFKSDFNLKSKQMPFNVESSSFALPVATCNGYNFINFTDEDGNVITEIPTGSVGNKVITANFEPIVYKIKRSYKLIDSGSEITDEQEYTIETAEFTLPVLESSEKTFVGWYEESASRMYGPTDKFGRGKTGDHTLKAIWKLNGEGTEDNPYQIFNANQLEEIDDMTAYYKLMNDITVTSTSTDIWVPVGSNGNQFNGKFDGNNKTISMVISSKAKENENYLNYFGLFGYVCSNAKLHDFKLVGSVGSSEERYPVNIFGSVAAYCCGTIENVNQNLSIYLTNNSEEASILRVGGLVGIGQTLSIKSCVVGLNEQSVLNVDGSLVDTVKCGGVVGETTGGIISNTIVNINVISKAMNNSYAGGFIGSRDADLPTNIESTTEPTSLSPFAGQVSSSVTSSTGGVGMVRFEGGKKALIGQPYYEGLKASAATYKIGNYYYCIVTDEDGLYGMCWAEYTGGTPAFDYSNPINMIQFN